VLQKLRDSHFGQGEGDGQERSASADPEVQPLWREPHDCVVLVEHVRDQRGGDGDEDREHREAKLSVVTCCFSGLIVGHFVFPALHASGSTAAERVT